MTKTRQTPRQPQQRPSDLATALVCILVIALLALSVWWSMTQAMPTEAELRPEYKVTHDSLEITHTYDGELDIRWYVFIDPDTNIQYLVNDLGGCTPRLDAYGNVMGMQYWYDE